MKKRFYPILLMAAALTFTQCKKEATPQASATQAAATQAAPAEKVYQYETVANDPLKARIYTLDNGLKVYLSDYEDAPRIQTYIAVRAGSKNDPADATGLAHYLEHMVFKGTSELGTQDWQKEKAELDKIEALYESYRRTRDEAQRKKLYHQIDSISGVAANYAVANEYDKIMGAIGAKNSNAYTWVEQTVYTEDIPSNQIEKWAMVQAERMREMVPRLFHTELEAVYEEKNRTLDSDSRKTFAALMEGLFPQHQYGTQTTIGTVEHLKNPSITEIKKYFDQYYVPNNMAIAMSGDLDFDQTIRIIDKHFGRLKQKPVPQFNVAQEQPIAQPVVKEVKGPDAEAVMIGFRFPGVKSREAVVLRMINQILSNGQAGLIDLNLNQQQKVLGAGAYELIMNDYSAHMLQGSPRQGQKLEDVQKLLLQQVELVKKGRFDDWLLEAIANNEQIRLMKSYENNSSRADAFVSAFVAGMDWKNYIDMTNALGTVTKQEVMDVANKYYGNNYVTVFKRVGQDPSVQKVEKPSITPVAVNRDVQSEFYKKVMAGQSPELMPVFIDYKKDIQELKLKKDIPLLYTKNNENGLFQLYYILDMGTNNDPKIGLAVQYLQYLGTDKYSPEELQKEFYKLGTSFDVFSSNDQIYVTLEGLDTNFDKALALFESLLRNPKADKQALNDLVDGILKERQDAKRNKDVILRQGLLNYAKYGSTNPFTNIIPERELKKIKPEELVNIIRSLNGYEHRVLYYGPRETGKLTASLNEGHLVPETLKPVPAEKVFKELDIKQPVVYWADYDMVQAEIMFLTKSLPYDKTLVPTITLYNQYFGGNMGSIVFQELRESKALAYSASSRYSTATKKDRSNYIVSYIGTQADKLPEAMTGMQALLTEMPEAAENFENAKASIRSTIASDRITKSGILFDYERAKRLGIEYDIRKDVYQSLNTMTMEQLRDFQNRLVKNQPQAILVIGSKDKLNFKELQKYGKVKQVSLKELFGY